MKHLFYSFVFLFVFNSCNVFSQDMTAISETGTWIMYHSWPEMVWDPNSGTYVPVGFDEWLLFKTGDDTLISGTVYKQLLMWGLDYDMMTGVYTTQGPGFPMLHYRNDNNLRAYRVMYGSSVEELWYDFNHQIGDTILGINQPAAFYPNTMYVTHQDSIVICDSTYMRFHYDNTPGQSSNDKHVIQRMGSTWNLIGENWTSTEWFEMTFFCESPTNIEDIVTITEYEVPTISLYPNPSSETIYLSGIDRVINYQIIGMDGRVIQMGRTKGQVDIKDISEGTYQIHFEELGVYSRFIKTSF